MAEQKFTPRAENVLRLAQETALELGHGYVGCEHILLGLLREDGSVIPNLYAAGDVCGSIEEKDGCNYKMGFDAAMTFGYIMADSINTDLSA